MKDLLIDLQFLPPVEYFCVLQGHKNLVLEAEENYIKQTYRNRCYVLGANGPQTLAVPVRHGKGRKIAMKNAEIDYSRKWHREHLRTLESAYSKAPFYEHYIDGFLEIYRKEHVLLWDLNKEMLTLCLGLLGSTYEVRNTEKYFQKEDLKEITDLRGAIIPKKKFNMRNFYTPVPYIQMFGKAFVENLSIIDLLFCCGPASLKVVTDSKKLV